MAAQLICNQWVAGSTPVTSSKKKSYDLPLDVEKLWGFSFYRALKTDRMCSAWSANSAGGEAVPSAETVEKIEHILQPVEKAVAEITVVNYPDCAVWHSPADKNTTTSSRPDEMSLEFVSL